MIYTIAFVLGILGVAFLLVGGIEIAAGNFLMGGCLLALGLLGIGAFIKMFAKASREVKE